MWSKNIDPYRLGPDDVVKEKRDDVTKRLLMLRARPMQELK